MKNYGKHFLVGWLCLFVDVSCAKKAINPFMAELPSATSNYAYSPENAIRMGYSKDYQVNVAYCHYFIDNLTTESGQRFHILSRASTNDPIHDATQLGFLGMVKRGSIPRGGILDLYELITDDGFDTLFLYFDIYHKDSLRVPRGLIFLGKIDVGDANE